jgi:hypothetical protein
VIAQSKYASSNYEPESTIRRGFELQSDIALLFGGMGSSFGTNFTANYRFSPNYALGLGFGGYFGSETWSPLFLNIVYNFTDSKLSPFVALEVGIASYEYYDHNNSYSDTDAYLGAIGGIQYSFNRKFALKASLKAATGLDYLGFNIGVGAGVVYHF